MQERIDAKGAGEVPTEYRVSLSTSIKLEAGEFLAMSGNLPALGMWTDYSKFPMVRAGADTWVSV